MASVEDIRVKVGEIIDDGNEKIAEVARADEVRAQFGSFLMGVAAQLKAVNEELRNWSLKVDSVTTLGISHDLARATEELGSDAPLVRQATNDFDAAHRLGRNDWLRLASSFEGAPIEKLSDELLATATTAEHLGGVAMDTQLSNPHSDGSQALELLQAGVQQLRQYRQTISGTQAQA